MNLSQKAGQVLMPFYAGLDYEAQAARIERLHLAGSIIMGDNVPKTVDGLVDTAAMATVTKRLSGAARSDGRGWPGLIGVDQEGGEVARLGAPLTEWPSPMSYGAAGSVPLATESGRALAAELAPLGFNVDFAPDADVTIGASDPTIGARSMSASPDAAAKLGVGFFRGMLAGGMLPAVKHFPGHGSVTVDSHEGLPVQNATVAQLRAKDWKPFKAAVDAGAPMVMTGHIAVTALEPGVPASLSKPAYAALRGMGFTGVAVTDALNMGAVQKQFPNGSAAPRALAAGADLLLMPADVEQAHAAIVSAATAGTLPAARLDEAARRVATMMIWREREHAKAAPGAAPGSGNTLSTKVSAAAVTILAGPCKGPMVPGSVRVAGGSAQDRARFEAAAQEAGVGLGTGPLVSLIGYGGRPVDGHIAVALDAPWALAGSTAPAKIALYGRSPGAFKALLAVLTGKAPAPGNLPSAFGGFRAGAGCP
ncbi:glycoside hydrolase family 3 N-terminal domain-containing protein [Micrococcaceae bacterium Sec5.7]